MAARKAFDRAALLRELRRDEKAKVRAKLHALRGRIRDARAARREALARARAFVRDNRVRLRDKARELRARLMQELRDRVAAERAEARRVLDAAYDEARLLKDQIVRDRAELRAEIAFQRTMRRIEAGHRARRAEVARKGQRHERLEQSDDAVLAEIPPELRALWKRVKHSIRGSRHMSRAEALMHYVHEHPDAYLHAIEDESEAKLAQLIAEREAHEQVVEERRGESEHAWSPDSDYAVPF
jgi:hypothetical protein